jgi:molybdopterin-containing oxidoreductase family membrane subunit
MVLTLLIPLRRIFGFEKIITLKDLESVAKTTILTGLIVGYSYIIEYFMAWYSGNTFEKQTFLFRALGHYGPQFWVMVFCNSVAPLLFFFKKIRTSLASLLIIAILINIGMWTERFVIIIGSMAQDFIPYQWGFYYLRWVEFSLTVASFCLFMFLFLLFAKFLPSISISEVKEDLTPIHRGKGKRDYHGA